jgi:transposase
VKRLWDIEVCDETIYNFLHKNELSYQRGHNDYEDACPYEQRAYVEELYKTLKNDDVGVKKFFFDECSMTNCGTIFYAWAKKNTRVRVYTRQRKKKRLNCFVSVDAVTGEEYIGFYNKSTFLEVSDYFYDLILKSHLKGYHKIIIILDNHKTHKDKMRYRLWLKVKANPLLADFEIEYLDTPRYSPDFNLAEYIIHQLRLKLLHHLPSNTTLLQIQNKILNFLKNNKLQTPKQIKNTINHILALGTLTSRI